MAVRGREPGEANADLAPAMFLAGLTVLINTAILIS
jgi:hypothetical protein